MLTQQRRARIRLLQAIDGGLFGAALGIAYWLRAYLSGGRLAELEPFSLYLELAPLAVLLGPLLLASQGFYERPRLAPRLSGAGALLRGCILTVFALVIILFLLRLQYARSVIIMTGALGGALVSIRAELVRRLDRVRQAHDQFGRRVLWVGLSEAAARLQSGLAADERELLRTVGTFDPRAEPIGSFAGILHRHSVNLVVVSQAGIGRDQIGPVLAACEREGVETLVRADLFHSPVFRPEIDRFAGEPVISYRPQAVPAGHLLAKRVLDWLAAAILALLLLPLFGLIAAAVKLTSRGPVIFRQRRCGLNGRPFDMLKFRSMSEDAPSRQAEVAARNEMRGPVFKMRDDPRITSVGRLLRRHALDELPQLWNVLRGEMSLVGPRPLPVEEVHRFDNDAYRRRLSVLPGMTCLWQARGRNDISDFEDWVRLDLEYIDQWSLWLDGRILLATIPVVLFGRGGR